MANLLAGLHEALRLLDASLGTNEPTLACKCHERMKKLLMDRHAEEDKRLTEDHKQQLELLRMRRSCYSDTFLSSFSKHPHPPIPEGHTGFLKLDDKWHFWDGDLWVEINDKMSRRDRLSCCRMADCYWRDKINHWANTEEAGSDSKLIAACEAKTAWQKWRPDAPADKVGP